MSEPAVWMELKLHLDPQTYRALEARSKPDELSVTEYLQQIIRRDISAHHLISKSIIIPNPTAGTGTQKGTCPLI